MSHRAGKVDVFPKVRNYLALAIISGLLSACGGNSGDDEKTPLSQPKNKVPSVSAGPDQTVKEMSDIVLNGSGSDSDGTISAYSWTQTAGTRGFIQNSGSATTSFRAPAVVTDEQLTLQLTVTDNEGAISSDSMVVTVITSTPEEAALALELAMKNIGYLSGSVNLPPVPDDSKAIATVAGVDSNRNGTRDDLENIAYQAMNLQPGMNIDTYNQMISILNMIQPPSAPVENSINELAIYCAYQPVPDNVKRKLPLRFLYSIVLDTQARKHAFYSSLTPSARNLGAEACE
ncbi:hypothetical protein LL240_13310 [Oceanimonas baumannii]|uniref:PKD domain-containing protein n=1 Tax=Oceanimonas baumannii TaxID=129578 RepID=UPI001D19817E|nr:hypothetical protein [Oceanimonas baumannii]MCC4265422.1 hypothetical protein [Oceanimonas baumannii]